MYQGLFVMKKFILNADNFGKTQDYNRAVLNGYNNGFLKSASIIANGNAFDTAINEILPECQHLSLGLHINLTDGAPISNLKLLVDNTGKFNTSFTKLNKLVKKTVYLNEIEQEIRAQLEKVTSQTKIDHIDSEDNIHCIPEIFNIVCKLAQEYNINYIRTFKEEFYIVPKLQYIIHPELINNFYNLIKNNQFANINKNILKNYNIKTNDFILGSLYANFMDENTLEYGLKALNKEESLTIEAVINPCSYLSNKNDSHSNEFKLTQNKILEDTIYRMGFEITNHKI